MRWRRRRFGKRRRAARKPDPFFAWLAGLGIAKRMDDLRGDAPTSLTAEGWHGRIDGFCPVQGFGLVDGFSWYFRARWDSWTFEVWDAPFAADGGLPDGDPIWGREEDYGDAFADASWMPYDDAWRFILQSIAAFRARAGAVAGAAS